LAWEKRKKRGAFGQLPVAVQRYLLQKRLVLNKIDPSFELIEKLRSAPDTWICVFGETRVLMDTQGEIKVGVIDKVKSFLQTETEAGWIDISADTGSVCLGNIRITWKRMPWREGEVRENKDKTEHFDAESVGKTIRLRYWRPGDRFHPIGMKGAVKLQDLFTNNKTPPAERHQRVVAETLDGRLFWVQGLRMSEPFKMVPTTRYCLRWSWEPA
jgi:tRNA(Ile)-lysidine synthase